MAAPLFPFTMAFQPIVDLKERRIDSHEALVRGTEGQGAGHVLGQLTPDTLYAFDQACRTKAIHLASKLGIGERLNINFLPNAVYEPSACIRATLQAARKTSFPTDRLTFEIVETEDIADAAHLKRIITEYRRHGFQIALDDFGAGHSNLVRLAELRPDIVKADQVLVRGCDKDQMRQAILASLVTMGEATGIKVVFEGVEEPSELAVLRAMGARFIQGYLFSRPMFEGLVPRSAIFTELAAA